MINKVLLTGRLISPVETVVLKSDLKKMVEFLVEVGAPFKNADGEQAFDTIRVIAFNGIVTNKWINSAKQGDIIEVEGHFSGKITTKNNESYVNMNIIADKVFVDLVDKNPIKANGLTGIANFFVFGELKEDLLIKTTTKGTQYAIATMDIPKFSADDTLSYDTIEISLWGKTFEDAKDLVRGHHLTVAGRVSDRVSEANGNTYHHVMAKADSISYFNPMTTRVLDSQLGRE